MAKRKGTVANDGLLGRSSGAWAREKLWYLERYMNIVSTGMKKRHTVFLDLMAGPGLCVERGSRREFDGSPLLALKTKTPFKDVILVEYEPELAAALRTRVARITDRPEPHIIEGDCNDTKIVAEIRARIPTTSLAVMFVDLLGSEVHYNTVKTLTLDRNVDLIVTFPDMDLNRNAISGQDDERWTRFFGTEEWNRVVERWTQPGRPEGTVALALARLYARQLQGLGYNYVKTMRESMKNRRGGVLYRPLFASRHMRGLDLWKKISARDIHGQSDIPGLF